MKRRNFLKSTLTLGGVAAATTGLTACSVNDGQCIDSDIAVDPLASFTKLGEIQAKSSDQIGHSYWGMGGESQEFDDMDHIDMRDLR